MTQFEENNPQQLKEFIRQLRMLTDEFHPNIYTIDGVFEGMDKIEQAVEDELAKQKSYI
jgi:sensor histidine kinase regulating citrate/malate metabolism